jgi:hypothetical protein
MPFEKCQHPVLEFIETSANDQGEIEYYPAIYGLKAVCVICGKCFFEDDYEQWKYK